MAPVAHELRARLGRPGTDADGHIPGGTGRGAQGNPGEPGRPSCDVGRLLLGRVAQRPGRHARPIPRREADPGGEWPVRGEVRPQAPRDPHEPLSASEREEFQATLQALGAPETRGKDAFLSRLGALAAQTDEYDPIRGEADESVTSAGQGDVFDRVWEAAAALRRSGELMDRVRAHPLPGGGDARRLRPPSSGGSGASLCRRSCRTSVSSSSRSADTRPGSRANRRGPASIGSSGMRSRGALDDSSSGTKDQGRRGRWFSLTAGPDHYQSVVGGQSLRAGRRGSSSADSGGMLFDYPYVAHADRHPPGGVQERDGHDQHLGAGSLDRPTGAGRLQLLS